MCFSKRSIGLSWVWACLVLIPGLAYSCGPDFPSQLLWDRKDSLQSLPEGIFDYEASHLIPSPTDQLHPLEAGPWDDQNLEKQRADVEATENPSLAEKLSAMRKAKPDEAYAIGAGLPEAVRLYTTGALFFAEGDFDAAIKNFEAVLALPAEQQTARAVWSAFMLGRIYASLGQNEKAIEAFERARSFARSGASDPVGLAVASFGEQARLALRAGQLPQAIALYAEQAARGSRSGRNSLLMLARHIMANEPILERTLTDPITQRLLVGYAYSRAEELADDPLMAAEDATSEDEQAIADESAISPAADELNEPPIAPSIPAAQRLLAALEKRQINEVSGTDRLAAVAYRAGKFDLARGLAEKDSSGLAWWVRAKLALRDGDAAKAASAYAQARKAFPPQEEVHNDSEPYRLQQLNPICRLDGEHGVLALSRGEYVQALDHLYAAGSHYWFDAAYVAERVLSLDELKQFVAEKAPPLPTNSDSGADEWLPQREIRALLARRLMREQRYDEALDFFDNVAHKKAAQDYITARRATEHGGRIERAQAWYQAAKLARFSGLEILGFEEAPDYAALSGSFELGGPEKIESEYTTADEQHRFLQTAANPPLRFHYRFVAVDHANHAADLLPNRSQAFAAVLCEATGWILDREPQRAQPVYLRYIKQGPYVPWAEDFGRNCEEPNFPRAAERLHFERMQMVRFYAKRLGPVAFIIIVLAGLGVYGLRRKKKAKNEALGKLG